MPLKLSTRLFRACEKLRDQGMDNYAALMAEAGNAILAFKKSPGRKRDEKFQREAMRFLARRDR